MCLLLGNSEFIITVVFGVTASFVVVVVTSLFLIFSFTLSPCSPICQIIKDVARLFLILSFTLSPCSPICYISSKGNLIIMSIVIIASTMTSTPVVVMLLGIHILASVLFLCYGRSGGVGVASKRPFPTDC